MQKNIQQDYLPSLIFGFLIPLAGLFFGYATKSLLIIFNPIAEILMYFANKICNLGSCDERDTVIVNFIAWPVLVLLMTYLYRNKKLRKIFIGASILCVLYVLLILFILLFTVD